MNQPINRSTTNIVIVSEYLSYDLIGDTINLSPTQHPLGLELTFVSRAEFST